MRLSIRPHFAALSILLFSGLIASVPGHADECPAWLDQDMRRLGSSEVVNLCDAYFGKPLLIINTASFCGYTGQFAELEQINEAYAQRGLQIIGFPSDSFNQEADDEEKTAEVCYLNYGVTFDMFSAIQVRGGDAHPLFVGLAEESRAPGWNFFKYLVDPSGASVEAFASGVKPTDRQLVEAIEKLL